jgi:hypothetical protein
VKAKQRIVVGTQVFRFGLAGSGVVEHPANRDAVNVCRGDAKADDAASEDVHDQHHPMAAHEDGFNAEQIDTPEGTVKLGSWGACSQTQARHIAAVLLPLIAAGWWLPKQRALSICGAQKFESLVIDG